MIKTKNKPMVMFALIVTLTLVMVPHTWATGDEDVIATGHIEAGVFAGYPIVHALTVLILGFFGPPHDTPYSVGVDVANEQGIWVEPLVTDNTGAGYYVDMYFYDEQENPLEAECQRTEDSHALMEQPVGSHLIRFRCLVPDGARLLIVTAHTGVDLDFTLVRLHTTPSIG